MFAGNRRALCSSCKTDPLTQNTLCKKCCRKSTVCSACYSRILSLHHTRLERYGSLTDSSATLAVCSGCDDRTLSSNTASITNMCTVTCLEGVVKKTRPRSLEGSQDNILTTSPGPLKHLPDKMEKTFCTPIVGRPPGSSEGMRQKVPSGSDSDYQSCSDNIDPGDT